MNTGIGGGTRLARLLDGPVGEVGDLSPPGSVCCLDTGERGDPGSVDGGTVTGGGGGGALVAGGASLRGVARLSWALSDSSSSDSDPALGDFSPDTGGAGGGRAVARQSLILTTKASAGIGRASTKPE